ncbi:hypothetical protein KI387_014947, partial [Taxus chinensis]
SKRLQGVRSENGENAGQSGGTADIAETSRASASDDNYFHSNLRAQGSTSVVPYRLRVSDRRRSHELHEEAWSCLVVLIAFWFFAASMTLILGFYGSSNLVLGPNNSRLVHANSFFVQEIR